MAKIYDTFMFFNELDLLEIRLNILDPYVDYFVISEATVTFSGKSKPLYFEENKERFKKFEHKIIHQIVDDTPNDFDTWILKHNFFTQYDKSYDHKSGGKFLKDLSLDFQREVYQRDSVINPLLEIALDDDIIIMSDLDEIPNPEKFTEIFSNLKDDNLIHCKQKWYMYYLNNYCDKDWFGTHVCKFKYLKQYSVDLLQYHKEDLTQQSGGPIIENAGWHFSFLGGEDNVKEKLEAYSYQGGRTAKVLSFLDKIFKNRIKKRIENNEDIFLTNRKFEIVDIDKAFPEFIIENQNKYKDMIK
jgi:beta-1,4-mannosyl-glycoprotein beta-1,4-N-acetylglucosaminyltransferase